MSAKAAASGHTVKHTSSKKHHGTTKHRQNHHKKPVTSKATGHKVTTKAHHAHHAKAVGYATGDWLPVCAFEAVAQSLRLAGQPVHDDDVCELWHLLGEPEEGVPVGEALAAVARFGLGCFRPSVRSYSFATRFDALTGGNAGRDSNPRQPFNARPARCSAAELPALPALILRVDVPGPHAVLATPGGWWSWGELYDPWPCRVEEAWAVSWT